MKPDSDYIAGPTEISAEEFVDAINVLPPLRWTGSGAVQSFFMSEYTTGTITTLYVRDGERYYCVSGDPSIATHDVLLQLVRNRQTLVDWMDHRTEVAS